MRTDDNARIVQQGRQTTIYTFDITQEKYKRMELFAEDQRRFPPPYDLVNRDATDPTARNCVGFVLDVLKAGGFTLPPDVAQAFNPNSFDDVVRRFYEDFWRQPQFNRELLRLGSESLQLLGAMLELAPELVGELVVQRLLDEVPPVIGSVVGLIFHLALRAVYRRDPLTLDLDGDGLETVGSTQSSILFDHDGDGILTGTGWVLGDDGFLVLDRNGNGVIDSGLELFGDATPLDGNGRARDGFEALAQEGTNGDGFVSAADARWNDLRVWRDANQDGVSQPDELLTLASLGITSLNVASTEHSRRLPNGNQIADLGTYTRSDGSSGTLGAVGQLADVNLAEDTFHRQFTDSIPLTEGVTDLPNMQASGKVRDLWEAASLSASLKDTLTLYSEAGSREAQLDLLDTLLLGWAQTAGLPDVYARAAALTGGNQYGANPHGYVIRWAAFGDAGGAPHQIGTWTDGGPVYDSAYAGLIQHWEQRFKVLEAFNGRPYFVFPRELGEGDEENALGYPFRRLVSGR